MAASINSLVWATDIDVLAADHTLARRAGYWVVQSPRNPTYWWGSFLLFDDAPRAGDGERWEALFAAEFAQRPEVTHCTLAWDRVDGEQGAAEHELVTRGYELECSAGLIARPERIRPHPRASCEVAVKALEPDGDHELWEAVIALQMSQAPEPYVGSEYHRQFLQRRQAGLRELFRSSRGAWYVALLGDQPVASLGIVVTGGRARFQNVDTAAAHRRKGIATRLIADAAQQAASRQPIDHFVIVADPDYHAIGIYEELGFERVELVVGALRKPAEA